MMEIGAVFGFFLLGPMMIPKEDVISMEGITDVAEWMDHMNAVAVKLFREKDSPVKGRLLGIFDDLDVAGHLNKFKTPTSQSSSQLYEGNIHYSAIWMVFKSKLLNCMKIPLKLDLPQSALRSGTVC